MQEHAEEPGCRESGGLPCAEVHPGDPGRNGFKEGEGCIGGGVGILPVKIRPGAARICQQVLCTPGGLIAQLQHVLRLHGRMTRQLLLEQIGKGHGQSP